MRRSKGNNARKVPGAAALCLVLLACVIGLPRGLRHASPFAFPAAEGAAAKLTAEKVRIQLVNGQSTLALRSSEVLVFEYGDRRTEIPPGAYTIRARKVRPARQRFHLFAKTFKPGESAVEQDYLDEWKAKGYRPEVVVMGRRFETLSGTVLDSRIHWISIVQSETESAANAQKAKLESEEQWTWMHAEVVEPGTAELMVSGGKGIVLGPCQTPLRIRSDGVIGLRGVDVGFWDEALEQRAYEGVLEIGVGADGRLELAETLPLESYVAGVLPAEMPSAWPLEALKAQAVAARSEVLANLAMKHRLEGFDFCGVEHCRAYAGAGGRHERTDAAVAATRGEVLVHGGRLVPALFSATCGGWTEDNETVWRAPPNEALRGVSDLAGGAGSAGGAGTAPPARRGLANWLTKAPKAYCSGDKKYFRWTRSYSTAELSSLVNKRHAVGRINEIQLGPRGVSGRLKWVRVVGSKKTLTIHKELPIRLAFGGLPSALFLLDTAPGSKGPRSFTFVGGGRGHGVGLCQYGARGMATQGIVYTEILKHYFSTVATERYR